MLARPDYTLIFAEALALVGILGIIIGTERWGAKILKVLEDIREELRGMNGKR